MVQRLRGEMRDLGNLEQALDASGVVGTWDWDIVRRVIRYDRGGAALLAGRPDLDGVALDQDTAWSHVHPADLPWLRTEVSRVVTAGGVFLAEYRVNTSEGEVRWILSRGRIYHNNVYQPVRGYGILIDITDSRDAGDGYVARAEPAATCLVDEAARDCIRLHQTLHALDNPLLRTMVDALLMEIGHDIARRIGPDRRRV